MGVALDTALAGFTAVLTGLTAHATHPDPAVGEVRIDRIAVLERIKAAAASAQQAEMVAFARAQVEEHLARVDAGGLDPDAVGRGIADQIALACRVSPHHGSRPLGVARALLDLPLTAALLAAGRISDHVAESVVSEIRHLGREQRHQVDKHLVDGGLAELSPRAAAALAKKHAYATDPAGYLARSRTARADRRVGLRPAPDTMSVLTGLLPVVQGVACLAALRAYTDTIVGGGDARSHDHIRPHRAGGPTSYSNGRGGVRPRQLRPGDARLAGRGRRRRAPARTAQRPDDHADRTHLHQHRGTGAVTRPTGRMAACPDHPSTTSRSARRRSGSASS